MKLDRPPRRRSRRAWRHRGRRGIHNGRPWAYERAVGGWTRRGGATACGVLSALRPLLLVDSRWACQRLSKRNWHVSAWHVSASH